MEIEPLMPGAPARDKIEDLKALAPHSVRIRQHLWVELGVVAESQYLCVHARGLSRKWLGTGSFSPEEEALSKTLLEHFDVCEKCMAGFAVYRLTK